MHHRHIARSALAIAAAALVVPAGAQQAAKPGPCTGYLAEDPAGDAKLGVAPAQANADLTGIYIRNDGSSVKAYMELADLTPTVPQGSTGIRYRFYVTIGDVFWYVQANLTSDGKYVFIYGNLDDGKVGDLTGTVYLGEKGAIEIPIPEKMGGTPGKKLAGIDAFASYTTQAATQTVDTVPDDTSPVGEDKTVAYSGAQCPAAAEATPAPSETPAAGATPTPAPAQSGTPTPTPAPAQQPQQQQQPSGASRNEEGAKRRAAYRKCVKKARKIRNAKKRKAAIKRCKKKLRGPR